MVFIMKKPKWAKSTTGSKLSFSEKRLGEMLDLLNVQFKHHAHIAGKEIDFLIKRPGKKGLIIEADGDMYHMDTKVKEIRNKHLKKAGFDIKHIWSSELLNATERVYADLAKLFGISNPPSICKKKKRKTAGKKPPVSRSPDSPRKKVYRI